MSERRQRGEISKIKGEDQSKGNSFSSNNVKASLFLRKLQ